MNATKRKFNTILQGLGQPRTSTDSQQSAGSSILTPSKSPNDSLKRRRVGQTPSTTPTSASPLPLPSTRPMLRKEAPQKPLAKFCPGDRAELLRRLATFHELTDWTPKPERVSEIEWAKRGWVCAGKERVRCVLCNKELVVKLNKKEVDGKEVFVFVASDIEAKLVDKYVELIVDAHRDDCIWRKQGCESNLLRLQLSSSMSTLEALRQRYDELCSRKPFLPDELNLRLPDGLNLEGVLANLPQDFFEGSSLPDGLSNETPNRVALALALTGWQGLDDPRIGPVPNSASCTTCLRRLGLWMFKSKEVDKQGNVVVPAPMDHLDPLREHRFFCPWKNADIQMRASTLESQDKDLPGWAMLLQTVANNSHLRSVYEGRNGGSKVTVIPNNPSTPVKGGATAIASSAPMTPVDVQSRRDIAATPAQEEREERGEDDEKEREEKDKERWARLRRVKSLFDIKGKRRSRAESRPDTRPDTARSAAPSIKSTKEPESPTKKD